MCFSCESEWSRQIDERERRKPSFRSAATERCSDLELYTSSAGNHPVGEDKTYAYLSRTRCAVDVSVLFCAYDRTHEKLWTKPRR